MRTTVSIDDDLINEARRLSGIEENGELIRHALRILVEHEASLRLDRLGGSCPDAWVPPRDRRRV